MLSGKVKFKHKIYSITIGVILFFLISSIFSYWSIVHISENIERLKKTNDELQKNLVFLSDIEKVKRYILEYSTSGDEDFVEPIETLFLSFENLTASSVYISQEYSHNYQKLMQNINQYKLNFIIAKEQVPLSFSLRKKLRKNAQMLEDSVNGLKQISMKNSDSLEFILFRNALLEVENGSARYFETDNINYVLIAEQELEKAKSLLEELYNTASFKEKESVRELSQELEKFKYIVNQTIQHYRTYSMLTKVVMPGDVYEIHHYSNKLKTITLENIEKTRVNIDYYIKLNRELTLVIVIMFVLLVFVSFFFIIKATLGPLKQLTVMFERLSAGDDEVEIPEYRHDDELGKLIKAANNYKTINKKTKELLLQTQDYQENLEKKVELEMSIRREREKALIQQSKLASMGEMIGAIAHQWRQPLNELSIRIQKLKYNYAKEEVNEEFIHTFIQKNKQTIEFMSKTIDDFRNFFRIDKEKRKFFIKKSIEEVLSIQNAQLKNHNIIVTLEGEEFTFKGFKTEFQQVIINLISNAKDAFVENKIKEPKINIELRAHSIYIQDNAGGIPEDIIERIFEPYFTTKGQGEGTGMGLYMSKMIIEDNMHSKIKAFNKDNGTLMSIVLKEEV